MKNLKITVNGKTYDVTVEEVGADTSVSPSAAASVPVSAPAPAPAPVPAGEGEKVTSPMPGNILDVRVSVGDVVKKGDVIIVLEAMKMENEIKALKDGTVTAVYVSKGYTANAGDPLYSIQ